MTNIPKDIVVIQRSKRKHSIVFRFWRRLFLLFFVMTLGLFLIYTLTGGLLIGWELLCVGASVSMFPALLYSFLNKGSLADVVYVDFIKQEISVIHYTLYGRQQKTIIPFEGMTWDVYYGNSTLDKLRIFPKNGKRVVICVGTLGWTFEDSELLKSVLSRIVERKHGIFRM